MKSVTITVSCLTGPYTSVNATLRLTGRKYQTSAIATTAADFAEKMDTPDPRFTTANIPVTAVAISSGQNDTSVFELSFKDERLVPFEGACAISAWSLSLPSVPRFGYASITDIVLQLRYTSVDGGDALGGPAADSVKAFLQQAQDISSSVGLFSIFDVKHEFATVWRAAMAVTLPTPTPTPAGKTITLTGLADRLPIWTRS